MNLRLISTATLVAGAVGVHAAPATSPVIGIVTVAGSAYNVSLLYDDAANYDAQSFNALAPSITFTTQAGGFSAATALFNEFGVTFDWHPVDSGFNGTRIVFRGDANSYDYFTIYSSGFLGPGGPMLNFPSNEGNTYSIAQFAPVPEPQTYALMALGLAGLIASVRRCRQA